jgi:sulfonate transport system substrate-binding protein
MNLFKTALVASAAALALSVVAAQSATVTFNIGYQKGGLPAFLKGNDTLEKYRKQGVIFTWTLFTSGPPLLEALNAGAVDFGSVGDAPGVFALSGGASLKYVAVSESKNPAADSSEAVIVPVTSSIRTVADLKGKRIALARGSSAHYFTYNALREAGLNITKDVDVVALQPPDARPALESGAVDAWAIWEPYLSIAMAGGKVRVLRDHKGLGRGNGYHLSNANVIRDPAKLRALQILLRELDQTSRWANTNVPKVIDVLNAELGIPKEILAVTVPKGVPYNIREFRAGDLQPLQRLADAFFEVKILPRQLTLQKNHYVALPVFGTEAR